MNLIELLKTAEKKSLRTYDVLQLSHFLQANKGRVDYYQVNEWNGDTYVILKWPHKTPGLVVLP